MIALSERGHQVDVYSHYPQKKPLPNYTDYSLAGSLPQLINNRTYERVTVDLGGVMPIKSWIDAAGVPLCKLMELPVLQKLLRDPPTDPPYDLIITEVNSL